LRSTICGAGVRAAAARGCTTGRGCVVVIVIAARSKAQQNQAQQQTIGSQSSNHERSPQ
jgi:hypothetical protein